MNPRLNFGQSRIVARRLNRLLHRHLALIATDFFSIARAVGSSNLLTNDFTAVHDVHSL